MQLKRSPVYFSPHLVPIIQSLLYMGWAIMAVAKNKCQNISRLSVVQGHNTKKKSQTDSVLWGHRKKTHGHWGWWHLRFVLFFLLLYSTPVPLNYHVYPNKKQSLFTVLNFQEHTDSTILTLCPITRWPHHFLDDELGKNSHLILR
jgi:hypothetical protein